MRYITFARVSGKKQDTEMQIRECNDYINSIKKDGDEVIHFDEGIKTTRMLMKNRPILNDMLKTLQKGDTLVVYKLNRLIRGHEMAMVYHLITEEIGANFVSLYEKGITMEIIHAYALVAAFERKNISQNTISGLKKKKSKMEKVGACLYGFKTDETKLQLDKEDCFSYGKPYLLIKDELEAQQVTIMVDMYKDGYSYGDIQKSLTEKGFVNRKGNPIHKSTILRVIKRLKPSRLIQTELAFV